MPISIEQLTAQIVPQRTVLLFGSGASIPSGAPSVAELCAHLTETFKMGPNDYSLSELTGIIENKTRSRAMMIAALRKPFEKLKPTGGLLNLPLYPWRSIFTTNYERLIEDAYARVGKPIQPYSCNFDFSQDTALDSTKLFKLHGTIEQDVSEGHKSRMIVTEHDYELTADYRELLYDRLKADLAGGHLIVIGHSLADPHIRELVNRAATINANSAGVGKISLLLFVEDGNRAALFESRGIDVTFGGVDDFFAALARGKPAEQLVYQSTGDVFDAVPGLHPITVDVQHAYNAADADPSSMFNGWPATYGDIAANLTFDRNAAALLFADVTERDIDFPVVLGPSGVGKTSAARQAMIQLKLRGMRAWEHKGDHIFRTQWWITVAEKLAERNEFGALFVDDAHLHLREINPLLDALATSKNRHLKIICVSSRNHWSVRVKSPAFFKQGREYEMLRLEGGEIDRLLNLVEQNPTLKPLLEDDFSGFSRTERRRRLVERCESETFVCLKNIFASDSFDDIILREYASLAEPLQDIYRVVAAMEHAGVRVHRQMIIRMLGLGAQRINAVLADLEGIISEYAIDERENIYGWRGRHPVIVGIISRNKFNDVDRVVALFDQIIDAISPTYEVERRSLREMCNLETGLPRIPDKRIQNRLLRRMISIAPAERVPRHRLIRNLLDLGEAEKAETEIKIFKKDFSRDAPVIRYEIDLLLARATKTKGILLEDRLTRLNEAAQLAASAIDRHGNNKSILGAFSNVGIAIYRQTGKYDVFDAAIAAMKAAESFVGDPDITAMIRAAERRIQGEVIELDAMELDNATEESLEA